MEDPLLVEDNHLYLVEEVDLLVRKLLLPNKSKWKLEPVGYGSSSWRDMEVRAGGIWKLELVGYGRLSCWDMEALAGGIWKLELMGHGSSS